ncbi:MAG: hypothetical protein ACK4YO_03005 [Candidatus Altarchaeaceae archaeon]
MQNSETIRKEIYEIANELEERKFKVIIYDSIRSCFDILAGIMEDIFIIKVFEFVEALNKENAYELKTLSNYLSAIPFIISKRSKSSILNDDVVYFRYEIPVVTKNLFINIIDKNFPFIYAVRGNYCMDIDIRIFNNIKKNLNLTLEDIAEQLNVSTQAVYRYEKLGRIPANLADKFVKIFGNEILKKKIEKKESESIYINERKANYEITKKIFQLGLNAWEGKSAFNVFTKIMKEEKGNLFIIIGRDPRTFEKKINLVEETIEIIPGNYLCVGKRKCLKTSKFLSEEDIKKIDTTEKFIEIIESLTN